jgi:hypothetical protein
MKPMTHAWICTTYHDGCQVSIAVLDRIIDEMTKLWHSGCLVDETWVGCCILGLQTLNGIDIASVGNDYGEVFKLFVLRHA